jgi:competence protein ComEC
MNALLARFFVALKTSYAADTDRLILLWPVGLMVGIGVYFSLDNEPSPYLAGGVFAAALLLLLAVMIWARRCVVIAFALFLIALGFADSSLRAALVRTPLLTEEMHNRQVEGVIDELEPVEKRVKLVLSQLVIEDVPPEETPRRLRISFRSMSSTTLKVGDHIRLTATLFPLPKPSMPGAYDFGRYFYFSRIGGNGFAMRPPVAVAPGKQSDWVAWLGNVRHRIGEDMRTHMPGASGTVAAAMTISETGPISVETQDNLRDSGLSHMLSISGLHLSIAAGILYFNIRLLLSLSTTMALRFPIKKIAAIAAPAGALIYLLLSGSPVPAVRSFIMVAVVFFGIILDRQSFTLRTLTLAAGLILLVYPESMLSASFQMSFAATLAIVSFSERFGALISRPALAWWQKIPYTLIGIAYTSMAATLATAPFVLYNFNRFAIFGLIANMIVIPLASFVIMPGIVIALLLFPFGKQWLGYIPLEFGTDIMLWVAGWVTHLPYASLHLPAPTDIGLIVAVAGLLWLCLMRQYWRVAGIPLVAAGMATMLLHSSPDVIISHDAHQMMVRVEGGHFTLLKGAARSFTVQNWLRAEGEEGVVKLKESGVECDKEQCMYRYKGHSVLLVKAAWDSEAAKTACTMPVDVMVAWHYLHKESCTGPKQLIGRDALERHGAHLIWMDTLRMKRTREGIGQRAWQLPLQEGAEQAENEEL